MAAVKESLWPPPLQPQPRQHLRFSGRGGRDIFLSVIATPGLRHERESIVVKSWEMIPGDRYVFLLAFESTCPEKNSSSYVKAVPFFRYWFKKKKCSLQYFTERIYLGNSQYFLKKLLPFFYANVLILEYLVRRINENVIARDIFEL